MSKMITLILAAMTVSSMALAQQLPEGLFYPNPGIIAQRSGVWVGSDHLYNLTDRIPVDVEIFKPDSVVVTVTETMIKNRIEEIFKKANIIPTSSEKPGQPPLPFFHALVIVYPIQGGFVAFTEGRVFEKVNLDRIRLDEQTAMQAITWESQNLIIAPQAELDVQIGKSIDEIANTFVERYRFYENIRTQIQK